MPIFHSMELEQHSGYNDLATGWTIWSLNPAEATDLSFSKMSTLALGLTRLPIQWITEFFPGLK